MLHRASVSGRSYGTTADGLNPEGLAELEGYDGTIPAGDLAENDDSSYRDAMRFFHKKWGGPAVAVCFKRRGGDNVQRRWAAIVNDSGLVSSQDEPVWHVPKEETGGGSAWASGFLYGLLEGGDAYAEMTDSATSTDFSVRDGRTFMSYRKPAHGVVAGRARRGAQNTTWTLSEAGGHDLDTSFGPVNYVGP